MTQIMDLVLDSPRIWKKYRKSLVQYNMGSVYSLLCTTVQIYTKTFNVTQTIRKIKLSIKVLGRESPFWQSGTVNTGGKTVLPRALRTAL